MLKISYCKKLFKINFLNNGKFASHFSHIGCAKNIKIKNIKSFYNISFQLKIHNMNSEFDSDNQYNQYQVNYITFYFIAIKIKFNKYSTK
jgi:hypothetical protein